MKKKILILLGIVLFVGLVTAEVITNINLNFGMENKRTFLRVGDGIGNNLKLIHLGCDEFCHFKLYEKGGINKEFKVELKSICKTEGICEDLGESYECCLEYRAETDEEVLAKAEKESKRILKHIASVTKQRENKRTERFEEVEIEI